MLHQDFQAAIKMYMLVYKKNFQMKPSWDKPNKQTKSQTCGSRFGCFVSSSYPTKPKSRMKYAAIIVFISRRFHPRSLVFFLGWRQSLIVAWRGSRMCCVIRSDTIKRIEKTPKKPKMRRKLEKSKTNSKTKKNEKQAKQVSSSYTVHKLQVTSFGTKFQTNKRQYTLV